MQKDDITPEITVLDIVAKYRETETVFKRYDAAAGECICCNALFDTLREVSDKYGINLPEMLQELKAEVTKQRDQPF